MIKKTAYLIIVTVIIGVLSGLSGMCIALLLHWIQHIAYGYSLQHIISPESFLQGVEAASGERRLLVLVICGLVAGIGWGLLYRFGTPLLGISNSIKKAEPMPVIATSIHSLLQVITVALGSPLGREVAPREIGALFAGWISQKSGLRSEDTRIMIACGAGAGLAAVYNVPLGGALFIAEVLLLSFNWSVLLPALVSSTIAVAVSWIGLGNQPQYDLSGLVLSPGIMAWSILTGPVYGLAGYWFSRIANQCRKAAKHNWQLPILCILNFSLIGVLAIFFPAILGNGKSVIHVEFGAVTLMSLSAILFLLRVITTWSSLRAGAEGGLLTPSMAAGALLGGFLGGLWNLYFPGIIPASFAAIGATAMLAASQKMPLTAIVLIFEFTRIDFSFIMPVLFAVCGSLAVCKLCMSLEK
ncbi:chloride channel protein [Legionella sp. 16cNR16C]|uniref:chloride channel protein n=1 Tax=Legionella sp. 16cNR16C TaxID=2905656 RepID=UPI001E373264|nr:chloride channel protein [Legionella sp. 16cNR16C]